MTAEVAGYMNGLKQAGTATRSLVGEMDKAARAGHLDQVADSAAVAGMGLLGLAGAAVKFNADFDKQMSAVSAATHATAGDLERLRQAALRAGQDTAYSATEAAQGIEELAKAGVSTTAILNGGLSGALSLAAAGNLDVAEAAETAASAMTQFGLKGADVPHIADLLAAAAGKAQGSVHDMGFALSQAGLVAHQMGLSVEDTTGTLAAFASAGLLGSDSGTSLKTALLMLANPTDKAKELMSELGIRTYDAQGKFVGITSLAGQLKTQLGGLTQEQRNSALATIFGSDAIRAASVLYQEGADGIQEWIDKTNDQGYAAETAAMKTDNLIGDVERLTGSLETMAIQAGSGSSSALRTLVQGADNLVGSLSGIPAPVQNAGVVIAGVGGAALLAAAAVAKLRGASTGALDQLREMGPTGAKAAEGLSRAGAAASRAAIGLAAVNTAAALMGSSMNPQVGALVAGLDRFVTSGTVAGETARLFGDDMGMLDTALKDIADTGRWSSISRGIGGTVEGLTGMGSVMNDSLTKSRERLAGLDAALSQMVQAGNGQQAAAVFDQIAQRARAQGVSVEELKRVLPGYAAAIETAAGATKDAAAPTQDLTGKTKEYKTAADAAAAAARGQRDALADLASKMKAETDPVFGFIDAQRDLERAQKDAAKAVKDHGRNSGEAKDATRDLALAAIELQSKAGDLGDTFNGKMTPALRTTLAAAGLTDKQIADVAKQFRTAKSDAEKYDGEYKANASAPGAEKADKQLKNAKGKADAFDGDYKAAISLVGYPVAMDRLERLYTYQQALKKGMIPKGFQGPVQGKDYATGGWTGPGGKYEPAGIVHADEFVIRKESRGKIEREHPGLLEEMNATGQVAGYAAGGPVRLPYPATVRQTRIPSRREVAEAVMPDFGAWPSGPGAQRGDTGVWRGIAALIRATGPMSGSFGNGYRPGDPLWHGSGRAVDWMGYNQDRLAAFLASRRPLELIHRTNSRDYAYTRGVNKGSFNESLMEAHRNHIHIAMANGGVIAEPVYGYGLRSGNSYSFAERGPERVFPGLGATPGGGVTNINLTVQVPPTVNKAEVGREVAGVLDEWARANGVTWRQRKGAA
ncbi:phage tail tape measure protein [Micromonospora aurantiaca (nom. illeg.)]|uniref:phage tail tape measure protein n=2 Tax=Micromonospora aurantiaca (nom. illeg.) TaxID=47850 RepID=UPI003F4A321E